MSVKNCESCGRFFNGQGLSDLFGPDFDKYCSPECARKAVGVIDRDVVAKLYKGRKEFNSKFSWFLVSVIAVLAVSFLFTDVWGENVWGVGVLCIVAIFVILISPRGPFGDGGN
tara:strand:- start:49 stop:390 length:342 start_codon:yes stop_codon:yes gene_type:complete